jgi:hypothetical protein
MLTFKQLKALGDMYEHESRLKIAKKYNVEVIEIQDETNFKKVHYDFKTSDNISYEVKADLMSQTTNNFFIEYEGYNKPSGLTITKAEKHILISGDEYYLIDTQQIKQLIKTNKYKKVMTQNKSTKGYLIPKEAIIRYSIILE